MTSIDSATINIVANAMHGAAQEMGLNLMRSARSTIIREARDFSCALLDAEGRLVAQAENAPIQMASLSLPLESCLRRYPAGTLDADDVFFTNDPYEGGQHLQDLIVFLPTISGGQLLGFAGSVAHHIDIGGGAPGLTLDAADIHAEGLRFTSMRLKVTDFDDGGFISDIVKANFREPITSMGDLRAQLAACHVGRERLVEISERYGAEVLAQCIDASLDHSEALMRAVISDLPDGQYAAEDMVDSGVTTPDPITVKLMITVAGDSLTCDFTGTDVQTDDFLNVPIASTLAAVHSAIAMFAVAGGRRISVNAGSFRPVTVDVPSGSFLNPVSPAAVRARMCGAYRAFDATLMALQLAAPERVPALGFNVNTTVGFTRRSEDGFRIFIEDLGGGWGATPATDGADMLDAPLSNCKITPTEVLELDHPYLRIVQYAYVPDSGGDGEFRGGLGSVREYEVIEDGVSFFAYADRHAFSPRGAAGGDPGTCGSFSVVSGGNETPLASKSSLPVSRGDSVRVIVGGGGGFGLATARAPGARLMDVRNGKVTTDT